MMTKAQKVHLLAVQIHYARSDGAECAETDSGGVDTPERWSPMRAMAEFERLPVARQEEWLKYAERIAPFCGVSLDDQACPDGRGGSNG